MQRSMLWVVGAAAAALVIGAAVASYAQPAGQMGDPRYHVVASGSGFVLWDAVSGQAWVLQSSRKEPGVFAWVPISRLANDQKADQWRRAHAAGQ